MVLLHVHGPMGWDDLKGRDGTFVGKAKELGLIEDPVMWYDTIIEAFGSIPGFGKKFGWLAALFANANIPDAQEVLDRVLADRRKFLHPANMQNDPDVRRARQYVLTRLEYIFRLMNVQHADGQTCCEFLGLEAPRNFDMNDNDVLDVIISL